MKSPTAFSIIELSVSLVIIGILVSGVMLGGNLIQSSRLTNARAFTSSSPVPNISCLLAWYELSNKISLKEEDAVDKHEVSEWRDISSLTSITNKKNILTSSNSNNVIYRKNGINKIPSLYVTGPGRLNINDFYQGTYSQYTIFLTFSPIYNVSNSAKIILDSGNTSSTDSSIALRNDRITLNAGTSVDTSIISNPANITQDGKYIMATYFDGASSKVYLNNANTPVGDGNINPGNNPLKGITVASDRSNASGFSGLISEIIIYSCPLKLQERRDVMKYLSNKYSIPTLGI